MNFRWSASSGSHERSLLSGGADGRWVRVGAIRPGSTDFRGILLPFDPSPAAAAEEVAADAVGAEDRGQSRDQRGIERDDFFDEGRFGDFAGAAGQLEAGCEPGLDRQREHAGRDGIEVEAGWYWPGRLSTAKFAKKTQRKQGKAVRRQISLE